MTPQPIISEQDKAQLKRTLHKDLKAQVNLKLFTQKPSPITIHGRECAYCPQTQKLMEELAELSPKLQLEIIDFYGQPEIATQCGVDRIPALLISSGGESPGVKFYGIPLRYEMATIIEDIMTISRGVSPLSMDTRKKLRQVNQPIHIQVFVTPTCQFCPSVARLAHALALENQHITADVVEVQEFPALAQRYTVRSVPLTVINEYTRFAGAMRESEFVEKVLHAGVSNTSQASKT